MKYFILINRISVQAFSLKFIIIIKKSLRCTRCRKEGHNKKTYTTVLLSRHQVVYRVSIHVYFMHTAYVCPCMIISFNYLYASLSKFQVRYHFHTNVWLAPLCSLPIKHVMSPSVPVQVGMQRHSLSDASTPLKLNPATNPLSRINSLNK